ncbi:MAG: MFS transporter [Gammaproteobacteria bacterium]|nr:MFS transporter [Gammaproteobacteria bacterium]
MKRNRSLSSLLWVMLFDHTSLNVIFPVLTLLFFDANSRLFAADTSHAVRSLWYGLFISIPNAVNFFATPLLSALSDVYGRKKLLIVGTFGALLYSSLAGFAVLYGSLSLLFLSCILRGIFSRTNPIAQAVIGDISPPDKKVIYMGYLQTAISMGAFLGPLIGGFFAHTVYFKQLNFSLPLFIAACFALISCVLVFILFRETFTKKAFVSPWQMMRWQNIRPVLLDRRVVKISTVLLLSQISWSLYYQFIPPIIKMLLHADAHMIGLFVGLIAFWLAIATAFGIRFLDSWMNPRQMLRFSLWLVFLGTLLTLFSFYQHSLSLLWIAAIPVAVGDVVAFSCLTTSYSDVVQPEEQGRVMGVCFIVIALVWMLTGLVGSAMMSVHTLLPLIVAPIGIVAALVLTLEK